MESLSLFKNVLSLRSVLLGAVAACLVCGCVSQEQRIRDTDRLLEAGRASDAVAQLERTDTKEYVAGNKLALALLMQANESRQPEPAQRALEVIERIRKPADASGLLDFYLSSLKFIALVKSGRIDESRNVLRAECRGAAASSQRYCTALMGGQAIESIGTTLPNTSLVYGRMYSASFEAAYGERPIQVLARAASIPAKAQAGTVGRHER